MEMNERSAWRSVSPHLPFIRFQERRDAIGGEFPRTVDPECTNGMVHSQVSENHLECERLVAKVNLSV